MKNVGLFVKFVFYFVNKSQKGLRIGSLQELDTTLAEIRNALEQGRDRKVAAYVQNSARWVDALDAFVNLAAQEVELLADRNRSSARQLAENPRCAD